MRRASRGLEDSAGRADRRRTAGAERGRSSTPVVCRQPEHVRPPYSSVLIRRCCPAATTRHGTRRARRQASSSTSTGGGELLLQSRPRLRLRSGAPRRNATRSRPARRTSTAPTSGSSGRVTSTTARASTSPQRLGRNPAAALTGSVTRTLPKWTGRRRVHSAASGFTPSDGASNEDRRAASARARGAARWGKLRAHAQRAFRAAGRFRFRKE
jgi:hypothetical protein